MTRLSEGEARCWDCVEAGDRDCPHCRIERLEAAMDVAEVERDDILKRLKALERRGR